MSDISRRTALTTGAALVTTGAITAPLAIKAAGVKAALGDDPVLPAYEAFEAARLKYIAASDHVYSVHEAVEAEMPPEPHRDRAWKELSPAEDEEARQWRVLCNRRVAARLGVNEDQFCKPYLDRVGLAYGSLTDIQATTVAGLLVQIRAWWHWHENMHDTEVPKPDPAQDDYDAEVIVRRLYHDVARLALEAPS